MPLPEFRNPGGDVGPQALHVRERVSGDVECGINHEWRQVERPRDALGLVVAWDV